MTMQITQGMPMLPMLLTVSPRGIERMAKLLVNQRGKEGLSDE